MVRCGVKTGEEYYFGQTRIRLGGNESDYRSKCARRAPLIMGDAENDPHAKYRPK